MLLEQRAPQARNANHPCVAAIGAQNREHLPHPSTSTERHVMSPGVESLIEQLTHACAVEKSQIVGQHENVCLRPQLEIEPTDRGRDLSKPPFGRVESTQGFLELSDEERRDGRKPVDEDGRRIRRRKEGLDSCTIDLRDGPTEGHRVVAAQAVYPRSGEVLCEIRLDADLAQSPLQARQDGRPFADEQRARACCYRVPPACGIPSVPWRSRAAISRIGWASSVGSSSVNSTPAWTISAATDSQVSPPVVSTQ
jgi:hypothetical protein